MAVALAGLCVLVYAALADALRRTRAIRAGLERLAAGDLSARLPPFDLAELSAVGNVFNHLAGSLETTLAERKALTQRLIVVQDEERQHLARELHDEFGQCLAAISAVAASAGQTAQLECPALMPECQSIARTAAHMMDALRGALLRLRSPDVDELGLAASPEGVVAGWSQGRCGPHAFFNRTVRRIRRAAAGFRGEPLPGCTGGHHQRRKTCAGVTGHPSSPQARGHRRRSSRPHRDRRRRRRPGRGRSHTQIRLGAAWHARTHHSARRQIEPGYLASERPRALRANSRPGRCSAPLRDKGCGMTEGATIM